MLPARTARLLQCLCLLHADVGGAFQNANLAYPAGRRKVLTTQRQFRTTDARLQQGSSRDARQWLWPQPEGNDDESAVQSPNTQQLFRHRFVVAKDFCIRMPLDAASLLRSCTMDSHLSTCIELQLEAFRPINKVQWSPDATRMLRMPNAGGSSLASEALAFEMLARAFGASLERTELELKYRQGSQLTDFAIEVFGGYPLGVSVTRAYVWHQPRTYTRGDGKMLPAGLEIADARRLLIKKLSASAQLPLPPHLPLPPLPPLPPWLPLPPLPHLALAWPAHACLRPVLTAPPCVRAVQSTRRAAMCKTTRGASSCSSCSPSLMATRHCSSASTPNCRPSCVRIRCCS
jgi:hypothetical protein